MTTVLITGASRGLGARTAERLAEQGCTVFAGTRRPSRGASAGGGPGIRPLTLDVLDNDSVAAAAQHVHEAVGSLDVLINNAGIPGPWGPAEDIQPDDFQDVFATNVLGPVRVTHAFLPLLRRGNRPRLVMVSSGMGSLNLQATDDTYRDIAHLPYPASKAALNMVTVQYAKALPDLLVTAVDPGLTATEFTNQTGHSIDEGSDAIVTAALDTVGPTGRFLDRHGVTPW